MRATNYAMIEDKQMSRAVQDACQRLTDAVNVIVGWQLESTTWLKRTLVVKQDTGRCLSERRVESGEMIAGGKSSQDVSPTMEALPMMTSSEASSLRGSTTSLANARQE